MITRSCSLLLLLLLSLSVIAQGGKSFLKEGDNFRKQGDLQKALDRYALAVQVDPELGKAWLAKAEVNALLGNLSESAMDLRKLSDLDPGEPEYATKAAKAFLDIDSASVALELLDQALRVKPDHMEALLTKARTCLALNDIDNAVRASDKALSIKGTTDSYFVHGLTRMAARDLKTAEFDLEKVLEWNYMYEPAYVALAEVQLGLYEQYSGGTMRMRTLEKAIEKCTRALELNPASTDALFTRSKAYGLQMDFTKAIDDVSRCIALGRTDVDVYHQRALYYKGFGQHQNAVNDLNRALLSEPANVDLLILRAECKELNLDMDGALHDLELAQRSMENDHSFSDQARNDLEVSRARIAEQVFEMNREQDQPVIMVLEPFRVNDVAQVSASLSFLKVSGYVRDKSHIKTIIVNGTKADFGKDEKDPQFVISIPFDRKDTLILVQAMDVYENMNSVELTVERTEGIPPTIMVTTPGPTGDREVTIPSGKDELFIEGMVNDASLIRMIAVNGVNASYAPDKIDPDFSIKVDVKDKDRIVLRAEDQYGNATEVAYTIIRKSVPVAAKPAPSNSASSATGITWVVHLENSSYRNFPSLPADPADARKMDKAFSSYNVQRTITKKNLTKDQLERFLNIELRDLVRTNKVNTILVWYSGHGRSIGGKSYWLPVDAKKDDIYSYFNYGSLKGQLQHYSESVNGTLVISDATGADPSFYELTR